MGNVIVLVAPMLFLALGLCVRRYSPRVRLLVACVVLALLLTLYLSGNNV